MQTLVRRVSQLHAALTCMLGNRPHRFMIKAVFAPAIAGGFLTELVVTSVAKNKYQTDSTSDTRNAYTKYLSDNTRSHWLAVNPMSK